MNVDPDHLERWTRTMVEYRTFRRDGTRDDPAFLEATDRALAWLDEWGRERGLRVDNWQNRVLTMTAGDGDPLTALVGHLDVVPPGGEPWEQDDPFEVRVRETGEGRILQGRGTVDDKGPLAALMAVMQGLAEDRIAAPGRVSLIVDTAEEVGFENLRAYLEDPGIEIPDRSLVADGFFPFVAGEKARLAFRVTLRPRAGAGRGSGTFRLIDLQGGQAVNQVPDRAAARIRSEGDVDPDLEEGIAAALSDGIADRLTVNREQEDTFTLTVAGDTAHAATPDEGYNAVAALFEVLGRLPGELGEWGPVVSRLGVLVNEEGNFRHDGDPLGLTAADDRFPRGTTLNLGTARLDPERSVLRLDFDARMVPGACTDDVLEAPVGTRLDADLGPAARLDVERLDHEPSLLVDPRRPLPAAVRTAYREVTGETADPVYTGGRTHATALPEAFTCGVMQPDRFEWYGFHGVDERVYRHELADTARVYAAVLERLAGEAS